MKSFSLVILSVLLVQLNLLAGGIVPVSRWQAHPILVDGRDNDWEKPINFYDAKTGLFFAIRNDSTTLYLNFTATDPDKISCLTQAGWSVSFQAKSKKSKTKGTLSFQASAGPPPFRGSERPTDNTMKDRPQGNNQLPERNESGENEENPSMPDLQQLNNYRLTFRQFTASGFIFTHGQVPVMSKKGIAVAVGQSDPAGLVYEVAIPLNELFDDDSVALNEKISMQIVVNALARQQGDAGPKSMEGDSGQTMGGGRPGGGMPGGGGPPGGGMPGGGMRGGGPPNNASSGESGSAAKTTFKQVFRLTSK